MLFLNLCFGYFAKMILFKNISLGLIEEYVYYIIVFIGILISYLLVRPFITWFVTLRSIRLLSYIISSLIVFVLLLYVTPFIGGLNLFLFKVVLQCLAVFGVVLFLFHAFKNINKKTQ